MTVEKVSNQSSIMKPAINCITLPVDDLQKSFEFYRNVLQLSGERPPAGEDHIAFTLAESFYLVFIVRSEFRVFTNKVGQSDTPRGSSECVLSYFAGGSTEVDSILERAEAAGAAFTVKAKSEAWGYCGYFKDPDGHVWEIMWNAGLVSS